MANDQDERSPSPEFSPLAIGEDFSPLPVYKAAGDTALDFGGLLAEPLQVHEDLASGLEIGAGGGLVGLAVARGCSVETPLYITDQLEMFELMKHNIVLNGVQERAKALILNWGEPLPQEVVDFKPDVILAADCVYFEPAFPLLLATLSDFLALNPSATIYFCFKKRRRADMHFLKKAQKAFQVTDVVDDDRSVFSREGLFLYAIRSRMPAK